MNVIVESTTASSTIYTDVNTEFLTLNTCPKSRSLNKTDEHLRALRTPTKPGPYGVRSDITQVKNARTSGEVRLPVYLTRERFRRDRRKTVLLLLRYMCPVMPISGPARSLH